jgi:eukaryotic-like serine/threonine-protein kinase
MSDDFDIEEAEAAVPQTQSAYRLLLKLQQGGMGDVFLAESVGLAGFRKLVVIKQLRGSLSADDEFLKMFLDEARIAARLSHPNVIQTNEIGRDERGAYFLAMEYLEGQALSRLWKRRGFEVHLGIDLHILCAALDGLHHAHELTDYGGEHFEVVHRDVSPQNLFVTYTGVTKVIDFGIARARGKSSVTQAGMFRGKLGYASPEQIAGDMVDRRADVYAVGMLLWEVLVGRSPWQGLENVEVTRRVVLGELPPLDVLVPHVPEALRAICKRALAHRKEDRFQTAAEMHAALDQFISAENLRVTPAVVGELMSRLFVAEREKLKQLIEAQRYSHGDLPVLGRQSTLSLPEAVWGQSTPAALHERTASSPRVALPAPPPPRQRLMWLMLAMLGIGLALGTGGGWLWLREPRVAPQPTVPAPVVRAPAPGPAPAPAPAPGPAPAPAPAVALPAFPVRVEVPLEAAPARSVTPRPARAGKGQVPAPRSAATSAPPQVQILEEPAVDILEP